MRYAQIENEVVTNVVLWDGESEVAGSDLLIECPDEVSVGWSYVDSTWAAPEPDTSHEPPARTAAELRHDEYNKPGGSNSLAMQVFRGEPGVTMADVKAEVRRVRDLYPDPA